MKKRIIALLSLVAIMATMLTVPVSAELIVNDTFDGMTTKQDVIDAGWAPYNYNASTNTPGMCGEVSFPDGAFRIAYKDGVRYFWNRSYTVPTQNHILMFDLKPEMNSAKVNFQFFIGSTRVTKQDHWIPIANEWYTYMFVVSGNATKVDGYYMKKDDPSGSWKKIVFNNGDANGTKPANTDTKFKFGFDTGSREDQTGAISYDNFRVMAGSVSFDDFVIGDTVIENVQDITAGTLKVNYEIDNVAADFAFDSTTNTYQLNETPVKAIMVCFDENMKVIDCKVEQKELSIGENNNLSSEITISSDDVAGINNSGYVGIYLWKGMQPLCEAKVLN